MMKATNNKYTLETLLPLNRSYDMKHSLTQGDVDMVNSLVEAIEGSRSNQVPKIGDRMRHVNRHGDSGFLYPPDQFLPPVQAIGNNYNQVVKAIKTNFGDKRAFVLLRKLEKGTVELVILSRQIVAFINEYKEKYLNAHLPD